MNRQSVDLILDSLSMEQYPRFGCQDLDRPLDLLARGQPWRYQRPHKLPYAVTNGFRRPVDQYHNNKRARKLSAG